MGLLRAHYEQHAAHSLDGELSVEGCIKLALHLGYPGEEDLISQLNDVLTEEPKALATADGLAGVAGSLGMATLGSSEVGASKRDLSGAPRARDGSKTRTGREKRKGNTEKGSP